VAFIDLQAFGLVQAAFGASLAKEGEGAQGLLDIGTTLTQVAPTKAGSTRFVRTIPIGGSQFTEAPAAGASMSREDAEERKRSIGVAPGGMPGRDDEQASLSRILSRAADGLIDGLRDSLDCCLTQAGEHAPARLMVCGNGARLPHLALRIGRALGTRVEPVRVLDHVSVGRVRLSEPQLLELQPVLPAAVGLALWGSYVVPPRNRSSPPA